jgi:hypothetical protein
MKKIMTFILGTLFLAPAEAQTLEGSLQETYTRFTAAHDMGAWMDAANRFALIATRWNQEWAANYYAAYAKAYVSLQETDPKRKDALLDEADSFVAKMNALNAASDESLVLGAYLAYARFSVDPRNRWQTYLKKMNEDLDKAKKVNPNNPRVYLLQAIPIFNKPKAYGGGPDKAKPVFEKARDLFAGQDTSSILKPYWGALENADYLGKCN